MVHGAGLPLWILAALTLLAYWPAYSAGFVYEDRNWLPGLLSPITLAPQRSLAQWSLSLNAAISGADPWSYHVLNVLWHCVNGGLVYTLVSRLTRRPEAAILAAGAFLLHPIQTEAVAYVSGRTEIVSASGILLACLLPWPLAVLAASAAIASKASAVVVVVLAPWVRRQTGQSWKPLLVLVSGAGIFAALTTFWPQGTLFDIVKGRWVATNPYLTASDESPLAFLVHQLTAWWQYVGLWVVPYGLSIDHDLLVVPNEIQALAVVLTIALVITIWHIRYHGSAYAPSAQIVALGLAWALIAVLPRLVMRIPEHFNEHQTYVPFIGLSLALGAMAYPDTKETARER